MKYAVAKLSVAAIRREPNPASEQLTQVLFGECLKVLEKRADFSRIRLAHDKYEGWLSNKQFEETDEQRYNELTAAPLALISSPVAELKFGNTSFKVLAGSRLLPDYELIAGELADLSKNKKDISSHAMNFSGSPYLWGGRSFFGIDCSGLAQMSYRLTGFSLPRDARDQAMLGEALSFIEEAEEGDLAFFDNEEGRITHVGIVLAGHKIIHASGSVRIDQLDQTGIYSSTDGKYTHKLRVIKRIV